MEDLVQSFIELFYGLTVKKFYSLNFLVFITHATMKLSILLMNYFVLINIKDYCQLPKNS